eukprot:GHVQ01030981.1.p1 GENE.GHVQ01030981.1~~GHVQ01030981.1.p1  ORF type:complete len:532 (-),score=105.93 GHVQ01030981.1:122-1717(-)
MFDEYNHTALQSCHKPTQAEGYTHPAPTKGLHSSSSSSSSSSAHRKFVAADTCSSGATGTFVSKDRVDYTDSNILRNEVYNDGQLGTPYLRKRLQAGGVHAGRVCFGMNEKVFHKSNIPDEARTCKIKTLRSLHSETLQLQKPPWDCSSSGPAVLQNTPNNLQHVYAISTNATVSSYPSESLHSSSHSQHNQTIHPNNYLHPCIAQKNSYQLQLPPYTLGGGSSQRHVRKRPIPIPLSSINHKSIGHGRDDEQAMMLFGCLPCGDISQLASTATLVNGRPPRKDFVVFDPAEPNNFKCDKLQLRSRALTEGRGGGGGGGGGSTKHVCDYASSSITDSNHSAPENNGNIGKTEERESWNSSSYFDKHDKETWRDRAKTLAAVSKRIRERKHNNKNNKDKDNNTTKSITEGEQVEEGFRGIVCLPSREKNRDLSPYERVNLIQEKERKAIVDDAETIHRIREQVKRELPEACDEAISSIARKKYLLLQQKKYSDVYAFTRKLFRYGFIHNICLYTHNISFVCIHITYGLVVYT